MTEKEKASKVIEIMEEWDSETVINTLQAYIPDAALAKLYDTLLHENVIFPDGELDDNTDPTLKAAIEYVHQTIDAPTIAIIRAKIDKNYEMHLNPAYGIDTSRVEELLNEYGETYLDAPEEWWEQFGDIDDILLKL